jgi:hypothetical protein
VAMIAIFANAVFFAKPLQILWAQHPILLLQYRLMVKIVCEVWKSLKCLVLEILDP